MRVLQSVTPSREQLPIVLNDRPGVGVVRGAAGSGKTTTALLRLKQLCVVRRSRRARLDQVEPVRVLVLTYNRSLAGYVSALAAEQVQQASDLDLTVCTFGKWASDVLNLTSLIDDDGRVRLLSRLGLSLSLSSAFIAEEVDYAFGRFPSGVIQQYLQRDRDGRGSMPRVDKQRMLTEVLEPYLAWKQQTGVIDWNDAAELLLTIPGPQYDLIVVDEAQDFSANQVRAVLAHQATDASTTFILDTVQRIYARFFTWREVGLDASRFVLNERLRQNRRNTRQIAAFARPLVEGLSFDENGQLPDLKSALTDGPMPRVFGGSFSQQADYIVRYLMSVDREESVGVLHPLGGGWFDYLRTRLQAAGLAYVELARNRDWPSGPVNVGLSTLHSAKGLEFDHVVVCGLTSKTAAAGREEDDSARLNLRRLLAMGVGRARRGLLLTHDPSNESQVLTYLDPGTYETVGAPVR